MTVALKSPYVCLSAKTRKNLHVGFRVTSVLTTVLCALYLGFVLYSLYRHEFLLHELIISMFDDLYKNLVAVGVLLFLLSFVSFKLNTDLANQPTNHSLPRAHAVCVSLSLLAVLATATCTTLMTRVVTVVEAEVGPRLKHGMSRYLETPSWGSALDRVQSFLECCGAHGPSDWYSIAWIPLEKLSNHKVDYKLVQPTGRVQVPLTPASCCRTTSPDCGHRAWLEAEDGVRPWTQVRPADPALLYSVGCEEAVRRTLARDLLVFKVILLVVVVLQVVLLVASRFLYSSTLNSVMLGRPQGSAPGWLVGPRLFGGKSRFGYLQEYDLRCQQIETGEPHDVSSRKTKWKCLSKMHCRKANKETSEETVPSSGKRRFKSPCLERLKSTKCVSKLKESYSRKFKKTKNRAVEYKPVDSGTAEESEPDMDLGRERMSDSDVEIRELTTMKASDESRRKSPERLRTGGDNNVEHETTRRGKTGLKKKLSANLIDFEDVHKVGNKKFNFFETGTKQQSPFSDKYEPAVRDIAGVADGSAILYEAKKQMSAVVNDFKKRRALFENATNSKSERQTDKVGKCKIADSPSTLKSLSFTDLEAIPSSKSLFSSGGLSTERTVSNSAKNKTKLRPVNLRNYPPLSPLE